MTAKILFLAAIMLAPAAAKIAVASPPTAKVLQLLQELKARAEADGAVQQTTYDKYACWCEDKLAETAGDMKKEKNTIEEMQVLILKLNGALGSLGAETKQLGKDIAANHASSKDAAAARDNEFQKYNKDKLATEQSIGSLEATIQVMTGAGTKKGFLDTTHATQLLSVVGQVRHLVAGPMPSSVSATDMLLLKQFVDKPEEFYPKSRGARSMSAIEVHGVPTQYNAASTEIQGIFKGMYDSFTSDLEKANVEEADAQKSFEALRAVKRSEAETLKATLEATESNLAVKNDELAKATLKRDDNMDLLNADKNFFEQTKDACATKAQEWSKQVRLRTEELFGMAGAIKTLSQGASNFGSAFGATAFLETAATNKHQQDDTRGSRKAYEKLKALATQFKSLELAKMAEASRESGHFDAEIGQIDKMVGVLRKEEQEDIDQKAECRAQQNDNKNDLEDIKHSLEKLQHSIQRMENTKGSLEGEIASLASGMSATEKDIGELKDFRHTTETQFQKALSDDAEAASAMNSAITSLSKFFKDNASLLQMHASGAPEYTRDADKAPGMSGANYGGRKSETTGIVAQLSMLVEDIEKEISEAKKDDADAQSEWEKQDAALHETLDAQAETKAATEKEKADIQARIAAANSIKSGKKGDASAEEETRLAIKEQCDWVDSHFDSRRQKRKVEIDGLVDAKDFLAGGLR